MNISNGTIAVPQVDVHKAVYIGKNQLVEFEKLLPTGYWKSIEQKVKTMAVAKKGIAVGSKVINDTQLISHV